MMYVPVIVGSAEAQWLFEISATHTCWSEAVMYQVLVFGHDLTKARAKALATDWLSKQPMAKHWCFSASVRLGAQAESPVAYGPEITILRAI